MDTPICLGDIESAAIRSLLGYRCLSPAGLAVNATTATFRIALGGAVQADDILTVNVLTEAGLVSDTYTVVGNEANIDAVATAAELVIEALVGVASAVAAGTNIDVTPAVATEGIEVSVTVTKAVGDPLLTASVTQTVLGAEAIKTANTFTFLKDGHVGTKTTTSNIAIEGDVIPVSSFKWWLVVIDANGNITTVEGTNGKNILPDIPAYKCPIGAVKVATDATHTFTPGLTGLHAAGITDTYFDLSCVPTAGYPA